MTVSDVTLGDLTTRDVDQQQSAMAAEGLGDQARQLPSANAQRWQLARAPAGEREDGDTGHKHPRVTAFPGKVGSEQAGNGDTAHVRTVLARAGQPGRQQTDRRPFQFTDHGFGESNRGGAANCAPDHHRRQFSGLQREALREIINIGVGQRDDPINRGIRHDHAARADQCSQPIPSSAPHIPNSLRTISQHRHSADVTLFSPNG
ncbi:MAG: hypothetical protein SYR96_35230 [Actinomycetota bacterium]|nr:hypothetical protein [Actinomycetota bacterium]